MVICYDIVFPRIAETVVKKDHILFSPSRIVKRGMTSWKTHVYLRSLETREPILATSFVNRKCQEIFNL